MSDSLGAPWSDNPYAPKIPYWVYYCEKIYFAGSLVGAIFYGIVIVLFFQCMGALLDPINRARGGIKWGLVAHTAAMFLLTTIYTAITLDIQSISFINNREFPGTSTDNLIPPGPIGYQWFIHYKAIGILPGSIMVLSGWLADGLLLYRCFVIYTKNFWVMIIPSMMYLASVATGILFVYQTSRPEHVDVTLDAIVTFGAPNFAITFSLSILLTLMIVARLVLHRRNIQKVMGAASGAGRLYKAIATIIIESFALSAIAFLLYVGPWAMKSPVQYIFSQILAQIQPIASFLITLQAANQKALTSDTVVSGRDSSIRFGSQGKPTGSDGTLPGGYPVNSKNGGEPDDGIEMRIDLHHSRVSSERTSGLDVPSR